LHPRRNGRQPLNLVWPHHPAACQPISRCRRWPHGCFKDRFRPDSDDPISANHVRSSGTSGLEMLTVSLSHVDPQGDV